MPKNVALKTNMNRIGFKTEMMKKAIAKVGRMKPKNFEDFLSGASKAFEDVSETVELFKNMRAKLKKQNSTLSPEDKVELLDEMKICKPATFERCYSRCMIKGGTSYLWCYVTSNLDKWETCGCLLRDDVIKYFGMIREQILNPPETPSLTETEVALVSTLTTVVFLTIALTTSMAIYIVRKKRNQQPALFGQPGLFIQNPIYQQPNAEEIHDF